jgi:hypothetical protein
MKLTEVLSERELAALRLAVGHAISAEARALEVCIKVRSNCATQSEVTKAITERQTLLTDLDGLRNKLGGGPEAARRERQAERDS